MEFPNTLRKKEELACRQSFERFCSASTINSAVETRFKLSEGFWLARDNIYPDVGDSTVESVGLVFRP